MFRLLHICRCHGPIKPSSRFFSTTRPHLVDPHPNAIHQIEQDGARILQAVRKRVKLRDELLANVSLLSKLLGIFGLVYIQMSEDMSSPEDIARARQLKELEPLHEAWSNWTHARQVCHVSPH